MLFSAQFSPDVVFHARYSHCLKRACKRVITCIGGAAIAGLTPAQLTVLSEFFDYVLVGHDLDVLLSAVMVGMTTPPNSPQVVRAAAPPKFSADYSLVPMTDIVTVYSGHGCYYGKCRFCDYPSRAHQKLYVRDANEVAADLQQVHRIQPTVEDIVLTLDCYKEPDLRNTACAIAGYGGRIPYNLMLRAERWITPAIGKLLAASGCTDVFIGAEALDAAILEVLRKGVSVADIEGSVRSLAEHVDVTIGLILFVPGVDQRSLQTQLMCLERMLPYIHHIEAEVLTIVNGSGFAREPGKYGIVLNATDQLLNDSWCYGLSPDIPWSMADPELFELWMSHADAIRYMCGDRVRPEYWAAVDDLRKASR